MSSEDRRQVNLPKDCVEILEDFGKRYKPVWSDKELNYPDTIRAMAASLDQKKYGKKK